LAVYLLGETLPELGGSEFAEAVLGVIGGRPPVLDFAAEHALHGLLAAAAAETLLASAHDCGDGGLGVALAESAIGAGHGFAVTVPGDLPAHVALFSESASRVVVSLDRVDEARFVALCSEAGVPATLLGETGGPRAVFDGLFEASVEELREAWEGVLPRALGEIA
jgi:phosphoribosylformylglycinamidine synthase subunit PurL